MHAVQCSSGLHSVFTLTPRGQSAVGFVVAVVVVAVEHSEKTWRIVLVSNTQLAYLICVQLADTS
jgi:hypothetical protein